MQRTAVVLIGGILLGVIAVSAGLRFIYSENLEADAVVRKFLQVDEPPPPARGDPTQDRYSGIRRFSDVLAQPGEFARIEALHVLAAGTDERGIERLISAASETADEIERIRFLEILFFRFAEIDPRAALALARTEQFAREKSLEDMVWRTWARADLDDALFAVNTESSYTVRMLSIDSLVKAFGYMGNETTDRIERETGTRPSRSTRARYLYLLADRSPSDAIEFINGLGNLDEQYEYVSWLAHYLAGREPQLGLSFANQFAAEKSAATYSAIIKRELARENPRETLEKLLAKEGTGTWRTEFHSALSALAKTDLEASLQYMERIRSTDMRHQSASVIAREMAKSDPEKALAWARENDRRDFPQVTMSVLGEIARTDPGRAIAEAQTMQGSTYTRFVLPNLMRQISRENPAEAAAYLDQVANPNDRAQAAESLLSTWVEQDAEAAIGWALDQGKEISARLLYSTADRLVQQDVDAAIRLLPHFDAAAKTRLQQQIAQNLAAYRSPAEAMAFVRQFEGQPGFDDLQSALIGGVVQDDLYLAAQLADQLSAGDARDRAYVQIIGTRAEIDPVEALGWLHKVGDASQRGAAVGRVVQSWYARNPDAAEDWAAALPPGATRDDAIMNLSSQWRSFGEERLALVESIEDPDKRGNAKISQIYRLIRTDPISAEALLDDEDIPAFQKNQVRDYLNRVLAN